tara:strand:+ start:2353 stop:2745 length:393 start_codon:yes stop_codon:yes gene_type:complete
MSNGFPPNFSPSEFRCKCHGVYCDGEPPNPDRIRHLAWALQHIRYQCGAPLSVTSGYRCPDHNKAVGGVKNSQHVQCNAADIQLSTPNNSKIADIAEELSDNLIVPIGGVGRYNTFTHVDIRYDKARWTG